jgi:hypothetical protein
MARAARPSSLLAALTATVACATALAAPAAADWETPVTTLSPYRLGTWDANVSLDGKGNALALWTSSDEVETPDRQNVYATGQPLGGAWAPLTEVWPAGYAAQPTLAGNAAGDAVAAWVGGPDGYEPTVNVIERSGATGAWGGHRSFGLPDVSQERPSVAINDRGDALVAWTEYTDGAMPVLRAATRTASGWSEPVTVSSVEEMVMSGSHLGPRLTLAADGTADLVWASMGTIGQRTAEFVQHSRFDGTSWSAPQNLATDVWGIYAVELSGDGVGGLTAAWIVGGFESPPVLQAGWRSGSGWTVTDVPAPLTVACTNPLAVGTGPGGRATFAWRSAESGALSTVAGVPGSWEQQRTAYTPPDGTTVDAVTLGERFGQAPAAVWTTSNYADMTFGAMGSQLAASGWRPPTVLSTTGGREYSRPSVAMDSTGRAIAAWTAYSGYAGKVQVTGTPGLPVPAPSPAPQGGPGTGGLGVLNPPFVRVRGGLLRLPRKGRTLTARLVNREQLTLRGTARLVHFYGRAKKGGSPMRTIAVQRRVRVAVKGPSKLRLKLNAEAIERLRKSRRHAYPARLYLDLKAPDGRTVKTTQTFTLDGWSRFGKGKSPRPVARKSC